jgi:hypothetical protein
MQKFRPQNRQNTQRIALLKERTSPTRWLAEPALGALCLSASFCVACVVCGPNRFFED